MPMLHVHATCRCSFRNTCPCYMYMPMLHVDVRSHSLPRRDPCSVTLTQEHNKVMKSVKPMKAMKGSGRRKALEVII